MRFAAVIAASLAGALLGCSSHPASDAPSLLVYQSSGRVRTISQDGTGARAVAPGVAGDQQHPDWSPDGDHLAFDVDFTTIWTVDGDGSNQRKVYECTVPCAVTQDPAWSRDGSRLAFTVAETDGTDTTRSAVLVLDLDTLDTSTAVEDTSGTVWFYGPRWSPDGTAIVVEADTFASRSFDETTVAAVELRIVDIGAAGARTLARWDGPVEGPSGPTPDWSPTGALVVSSRDGNLWSVPTDGGDPHQLTTYDGVGEHAIQPTFSPDGSSIIFTHVIGRFGVDDEPAAAMIPAGGGTVTDLASGQQLTHVRPRPT